jgi:hypothetical protein
MTEIGYQWWAILPLDSDPATGEATIQNPPMLTVIAVDRGASLIFRFASPPGALQVSVETTGLSAEDRGPDLFRTYTGSIAKALRETDRSPWEKSYEGLYATFTSKVEGVQGYLKLVLDEPRTLVVNRVAFAR